MTLAAALLCLSGLLVAGHANAVAPEIELELTPVKPSFVLGEPVAVRMVLTNVSPRAMRLDLQYPRYLGLSFTCADRDVLRRTGELVTDRRIVAFTLQSKERYEAVLALDRYFVFRRAKRYSVEYEASHWELRRGEEPSHKVHRCTGHIEVDLREGPVPADLLPSLQEQLGSDDPLKQREAAELMLWVTDPAAIEGLVMTVDALPAVGLDMVEALRKFAHTDEGRSAILAVARIGGGYTARAALRACADLDIPVGDDLYRELLAARDRQKRFYALEDLGKYGTASHVEMVKPLENDDNKIIAKMAREFVAKFEGAAAEPDGKPAQEGLPMLSVTLRPQAFRLCDPAYIEVELKNTTDRAIRFMSIYDFDLHLVLPEGQGDGISLVPMITPADLWRAAVTVGPRERWRVSYPLYDFVRVTAPGECRVSYQHSVEVLREGEASPLDGDVITTRGTLAFTVYVCVPFAFGKLGAEGLIADLTYQLRVPGGAEAAVERLAFIADPIAVDPLADAWPLVSDRRQLDIAYALIRIGTDAAAAELDRLVPTMDSGYQLSLVQGLWRYADDPVRRRYAIRIWEWGSRSDDEDVRSVSESALKRYRDAE